jgi:hypothetical protein
MAAANSTHSLAEYLFTNSHINATKLIKRIRRIIAARFEN